MSSSSSPPLRRRIGCGVLLLGFAVAGPVGCGGGTGLTGGSDEVIPTGEGQAVIPKQELINLGQTEKGLAPTPKKVR